MKRKGTSGFTLIELLVVIAIIALLIGILLPALGRARNSSRLAISLSNCRQIVVGQASYRFDKKDQMPMQACGYTNPPNQQVTGGWDTWNYGGKNNYGSGGDNYWISANAVFDEPAYCRPLNAYLYPATAIDPPNGHAGNHDGRGHVHGTPTVQDREQLQMPAFKSPGDKFSCQRASWPNPDPSAPSSYNDVGTSYHLNMKWWDQIYQPQISGLPPIPGISGDFTKSYIEGARREKLASEFDPSNKFVVLNDQTTDSVANAQIVGFKIMGEYGDVNKSVHSYLDGHVLYNKVYRGCLYDPVLISAGHYAVGKYTFIFQTIGEHLPTPPTE